MIDSANQRASSRPAGTVLLTLVGLAAAFGAASCCGLPLLLTSLRVGSAWLTGLALLAAPNRLLLLTLGAGGLASGAVLLWRRGTCAPGAICLRPAFRDTLLVALIVGMLLYLGFAYA
jgi:mercuric ion transport protein